MTSTGRTYLWFLAWVLFLLGCLLYVIWPAAAVAR